MDWRSLLFSFRGRINRAKFWLAMLVFFVADIVLGLIGWVRGDYSAFEIVSAVVNLALFIAGIAVCIKRLHDRDRFGWWLLLFYFGPAIFILLGGFTFWAFAGTAGDAAAWSFLLLKLCLLGGFALGIWGLVEIGFRRGTAGYNRFGPDPLREQHASARHR
jgi:uncharacterized membrane protein YhaH (DUF805 family)